MLEGIENLKIEPVNHISNLEPTESYFKCSLTKYGIEGQGIGDTADQALLDAIDWIESYNLKSNEDKEESTTEFPF